VLDRGRMVGFDVHTRLLGTCETYRQLWASQGALVNDSSETSLPRSEMVDV